MNKLSLAGKSPTEFFPTRPNFGTHGKEVILWANYFKLNVKVPNLYAYTLTVTRKPEDTTAKPAPAEPATPAQDPKSAGPKSKKSKGSKGPKEPSPQSVEKPVQASASAPSNEPKSGDSGKDEVKGKKLAEIIDLALKMLPPVAVVASEFKSVVVSLTDLKVPGTMEVPYASPARNRVDVYNVNWNGPKHVPVGLMAKYLATMDDPGSDTVFPKFPEVISAINVILGHRARTDAQVVAMGSSRFFAVDHRLEAASMPAGCPISILRGYFQSVRSTTNRLLLNTNVTHGVFRRRVRLTDLFTEMRLVRMNQLAMNDRGQLAEQLKILQKVLSKSRVNAKTWNEDTKQWVVVPRGVAGLATSSDGGKGQGDERPRFAHNFPYGGPATVQFYLRSPVSAANKVPGLKYDSYVTVQEYFEKSETTISPAGAERTVD